MIEILTSIPVGWWVVLGSAVVMSVVATLLVSSSSEDREPYNDTRRHFDHMDVAHRINDARPSAELAGPASELGTQSLERIAISQAAEPDAATYDVQQVLFGTDRGIEAQTDHKVMFNSTRADALTLGIANVTIPKSHALGRIERPRHLNLLVAKFRIQRESRDKHFTFQSCQTSTLSEFKSVAATQVQRAETFAGTAFLFLHGFNVSFENAIFRTAQIAADLNFDGPAFAYAWPAAGGVKNYATDMDSATQAAPHIDRFIDHILTIPGIERLHMVAHSMGNAVLSELVRRVGTKLQERKGHSIDQLILAAPDIDRSLFDDVATHFTRHARAVTLYACSSDRALGMARRIRSDYFRAGDVPPHGPVIAPGIDTLDVTAVGTDILSLNHSAYAEKRGLLDDLGVLMGAGTRPPPERMPTIKTRSTAEGTYWVMPP